MNTNVTGFQFFQKSLHSCANWTKVASALEGLKSPDIVCISEAKWLIGQLNCALRGHMASDNTPLL